MATERVKYLGKRELTIKEFEALDTLNPNIDYNLTDFPQFYITNEQMSYALTCKRLFNIGSTFICSDEGNYSKGHIYQIIGNPKEWKDITATVNVDNITINKNVNNNIQAIGVMDETNNVNKVHSALTKEQFDALTEYDENTFYPVIDETGVDSIGGATGDILLGTNLSMTGNTLNASGGLQEVKASDVNSETATQGQVLTADGSGGASWQNASGGGSQLYQHCINVYDAFRYTNFYAILITSSPTLFDYSSLLNYIKDKGEFSCTGTGSFDREKKYLIKTFSYGGDSAIFISIISDLSTYDDMSGVCSATDVYDVVTPL